MKKLLFLLLLSPVFANGQKLVKDEVDRFTKKHEKVTNWNKLVYKGMSAVRVSAANIDNDIFISFMIALHGNKLKSVHQGDYVMLLMDDDQSVKLTIAESKLSETDRGTSRSTDFESLQFPTLPPSAEDLKKLRTQAIKAVRIYLGNAAPLEYDVAEKFSTSVKDCINLVK